MAPGQTHVHRDKFQPNKVLLSEQYNYSTANIEGLTVYTILIIYGCPIDNNVTTGYVISTSNAKIDFVTRKSYMYKNNLDFSSKLASANNLTQLTQANEHTMSVDQAVEITNTTV
jgi:hypothetical protein